MTISMDNDWLGRLAHDLRGPLSPMQLATDLLREPGLDEAGRARLLDLLDGQLQRLGTMVDEFDDLLAADRGQLVAVREPVDIAALVADAAARPGGRATRVAEGPGVAALRVEGDGRRLAQLVDTLLGFGAPRGADGAVDAVLSRDGARLRLACTVPHPGASDALAASLLVAPHPEPPNGALGLALPLARAIARAHGGELAASARGGDRLEFVLELPLPTA